jgi:hypothetical protein
MSYIINVMLTTPTGARYQKEVKLPARAYKQLQPIDRSVERLSGRLFEHMTLNAVDRIDGDRATLLEEVAKHMADELLTMVKRQDTINGYTHEENVQHFRPEG